MDKYEPGGIQADDYSVQRALLTYIRLANLSHTLKPGADVFSGVVTGNENLFGINNGGTNSQQTGDIYFYGFKAYTGVTLVRDLIPCYRIADNEIGMYDIVNDVFYTNAGTGTFTKGADV